MQVMFSNCFLAVNLLVQWSPHLIEFKKNPPFKDPGYVPEMRDTYVHLYDNTYSLFTELKNTCTYQNMLYREFLTKPSKNYMP